MFYYSDMYKWHVHTEKNIYIKHDKHPTHRAYTLGETYKCADMKIAFMSSVFIPFNPNLDSIINSM